MDAIHSHPFTKHFVHQPIHRFVYPSISNAQTRPLAPDTFVCSTIELSAIFANQELGCLRLQRHPPTF